MPGLVPGIHVLKLGKFKDVDGRDKRRHDLINRAQLIVAGTHAELARRTAQIGKARFFEHRRLPD